jgi:hypothetical protein
MPRKEPDLTSIAKKLTGQKVECTTEMKHLLDCMLVSGMLVVACLQTADSDG